MKNPGKTAIPKKLGFKREAVIQVNEKDDRGKRKQDEIWVLFKDEYKKLAPVNLKIEAFDVISRKIL